jgi:tripartite-type tricarboxylate transporter receptor subunit TctC
MLRMRFLGPLFLGLLLAVGAAAETYPAHPVKLIIPFPPGGSNDIVGRMVAAQLGERLGQQVVVDNRGGAGGTIGTGIAAKSPPDGYTILLVSVAYAFNPALYKQLPYDPVAGFTPIGMLATGPVVLTINPQLPFQTAQDLIAEAKRKPGDLRFASAGVGSLQHLAAELFLREAGIDMLHVPYKGGGPATLDVVAGHAEVSIGSLIQNLPHIRNGGLRALAVSGAKRNPALPEVPSASEAGIPGWDAANWWGLVAPLGTPAPIVERLHQELDAVLAADETKKRFETEGAEPLSMPPEAFGKYVSAEIEKWGRVVKAAGIKAE